MSAAGIAWTASSRVRGVLRLALVLAVVSPGCARCRAPIEEARGTMDSGLKKLGKVGPSQTLDTAARSRVDAAPIALWSGAAEPVVVLHGVSSAETSSGFRVEQRFFRADGSSAGPFPIEVASTLPRDAHSEEPLDQYDRLVLTADLDGDGADELVLFRTHGGVEVYGVQRVLHRSPGLGERAGVVRYEPRLSSRARFGNKEVLIVLFARKVFGERAEAELARTGFGQRHVLVRIDDRGATTVPIEAEGFAPETVIAVGALSRPGAQGIAELAVLSRLVRGGAPMLSRHRSDGKLLAPPREVYVPLDATEARFEMLGQTGRALVASGGSLYFVTPEKPVNWIRVVELNGLPDAEKWMAFLGVVDAQTVPKAIVRIGGALYAVDEEGATYVAGSSGWTRAPTREPFQRLTPPTPEHHLVGVFADRDRSDAFLVVHTRGAAVRVPTDEELERAAERFLRPDRAAPSLVPTLAGYDGVRDQFIAEERAATAADAPKTVDEWRTQLPASYAKWSDFAKQHRRSWIAVLLLGTPDPSRRARYVDWDGFVAWRRELLSPADTSLVLIRSGRRALGLHVAGELPLTVESSLDRPLVDFRAREKVAAVFPLDVGEPGVPQLGYYLVTGP